MLDELAIENLGVIERARVRLGPGLTVVTGETGAGKTMVLTGLGLILGGRSAPATIRSGAAEAVVEAVLTVVPGEAAALVEDAGGVIEDGEVIVTRSVGPARSRATLGGRSVPQSLLSELAGHLVTVHGQADQARLRSASRQRDLLDAYAGPDHGLTLDDYRAAWSRWTQTIRDLEAMRDGAAQSRETARRFRDDVAAIDAVDPQDGEDVSLAAESAILDNIEAVRHGMAGAQEALAGEAEGAAVAALDAARRALAESAHHDPTLVDWERRTAELAYLASDIASELRARLETLEADPARLDEIHSRRSAISTLLRRTGTDFPGLLAFREQARMAVLADDTWDERLASLEAAESQARSDLSQVADRVSAGRAAAASGLAERVAAELALLAMPDARFDVVLDEGDLGAHGRETVSMTLAAHPGATPRPVAQAASGGELSRIMLAIEVALADHAPQGGHTFIFDEVDAGVGGRAALAVGQRLAALARTHQVIVVTHLAQVAAHADHHLVVDKSVTEGTTATVITPVSDQARLEELARLLSGHEDSDTALAHARELWEASRVTR